MARSSAVPAAPASVLFAAWWRWSLGAVVLSGGLWALGVTLGLAPLPRLAATDALAQLDAQLWLTRFSWGTLLLLLGASVVLSACTGWWALQGRRPEVACHAAWFAALGAGTAGALGHTGSVMCAALLSTAMVAGVRNRSALACVLAALAMLLSPWAVLPALVVLGTSVSASQWRQEAKWAPVAVGTLVLVALGWTCVRLFGIPPALPDMTVWMNSRVALADEALAIASTPYRAPWLALLLAAIVTTLVVAPSPRWRGLLLAGVASALLFFDAWWPVAMLSVLPLAMRGTQLQAQQLGGTPFLTVLLSILWSLSVIAPWR